MGDLSEHFSRWEFRCKCGCGSDHVHTQLVQQLEAARVLFGRGITITSGCRCRDHNLKVKGETRSAHLTELDGIAYPGRAVDIACYNSGTRMALLMALLTVGFERIGIGEDFLHVDVDRTLPRDVCWIYPAEKRRWTPS